MGPSSLPLERSTAALLSSTHVYCGQMVAHLSYYTEVLLYNRKINMTFEYKIKTTYKEVTENSDVSSKNLKSELKKINYGVVDASLKNLKFS